MGTLFYTVNLLAVCWAGFLSLILGPSLHIIHVFHKDLFARAFFFEVGIVSGLASYALIILIAVHYWLPYLGFQCRLPCPTVLWFGNLLIIVVAFMNVFKAFKYKVMSERHLRIQLHSAFQIKNVLFRVFLPAFSFFVAATAIIQALDSSYSIKSETCKITEWYYLWLIAVPAIPLKLWENSVLMKAKLPNVDIRKQVISMKVDTFGVITMQLLQVYTTVVFAVGGSVMDFEDRTRVSGLILSISMSSQLLCHIILPAQKLKRQALCSTKVLPVYIITKVERKIERTEKTSNDLEMGLDLKSNLMELCQTRHQREVMEILSAPTSSMKLRAYAQEMFCAETIDFIIDACGFKDIMLKYQQQHHRSQQAIKRIHDTVLKIIEEFISSDAPCGINVPWKMISDIERNAEFSFFVGQTFEQQFGIFDQAITELADLVSCNLLTPFKIREAEREGVLSTQGGRGRKPSTLGMLGCCQKRRKHRCRINAA